MLQKMVKYRILFRNILTFLELDYKDALIMIFYLVFQGIIIKSEITNNCMIEELFFTKTRSVTK